MKQKITPTQREVRIPDEDFIVSKTDTRGNVTYINRTFMSVSGFIEDEVLGQPHNIIRHPDMPRAVFQLLWQTLKSGEEFFGYVKNLCKDGSHYWVYANITPDFDAQGKLQGYYSARRRPSTKAIEIISALYREMLSLEQQHGDQGGIQASSRYLEQQLEQRQLAYRNFV